MDHSWKEKEKQTNNHLSEDSVMLELKEMDHSQGEAQAKA